MIEYMSEQTCEERKKPHDIEIMQIFMFREKKNQIFMIDFTAPIHLNMFVIDVLL